MAAPTADLGALLLWLTCVFEMGPEEAVATAVTLLIACGAEPDPVVTPLQVAPSDDVCIRAAPAA